MYYYLKISEVGSMVLDFEDDVDDDDKDDYGGYDDDE